MEIFISPEWLIKSPWRETYAQALGLRIWIEGSGRKTILRSVLISAQVSSAVGMPLTEVKVRGTVYEKISFIIYHAVVSIMLVGLRACFATDLDLESRCSAAWEDLPKLLLESLLARVSRGHLVHL